MSAIFLKTIFDDFWLILEGGGVAGGGKLHLRLWNTCVNTYIGIGVSLVETRRLS